MKIFCSFTGGKDDSSVIWDNGIFNVSSRNILSGGKPKTKEDILQWESEIIAELNQGVRGSQKVKWLTILYWQYV